MQDDSSAALVYTTSINKHGNRVEATVFNGIKFRRYPDSKNQSDRNYFRPHSGHIRDGVGALHVEVWKSQNGPIPKGHHVHHKDENTGNNSIDNLALMPGGDHLSFHGKKHTPDLEQLAAIRILTKEWHASEEGRLWHSEHAKKNWEHRKPNRFICVHCGKPFYSLLTSATKFCGNNCKSAARRESGVDDIQRICASCGVVFTTNKYSRQLACSRACGMVVKKMNRRLAA